MDNPQTGPDPYVMAAIERGNKVVFFDVALGGGSDGGPDAEDKSRPLGRIKFELFVKDVSDAHMFILLIVVDWLNTLSLYILNHSDIILTTL